MGLQELKNRGSRAILLTFSTFCIFLHISLQLSFLVELYFRLFWLCTSFGFLLIYTLFYLSEHFEAHDFFILFSIQLTTTNKTQIDSKLVCHIKLTLNGNKICEQKIHKSGFTIVYEIFIKDNIFHKVIIVHHNVELRTCSDHSKLKSEKIEVETKNIKARAITKCSYK